jgi:large subunit ribosomal protein L25
MNTLSLTATLRSTFGKTHNKKFRSQGLIPSVIYGGTAEPTSILINPIDLQKLFFRSDFGKNTLISIEVTGSNTPEVVIPHQVERDTFTQQFTHIDFMRVTDSAPVNIIVPIVLKGVAPGTKVGGTLDKKLEKIKLRCLPQDIIPQVSVDITGLGIGNSIFVSDLNLGDAISIVNKGTELIAKVTIPRGKVADETEEGAGQAQGKAKPAASKPAAAKPAAKK